MFFVHSDLIGRSSIISTTGEFTVAVAVANAGSLPGREAALVFVSDTILSSPRSARELEGFKKKRKLGLGEN
jgi:hypothetical protein